MGFFQIHDFSMGRQLVLHGKSPLGLQRPRGRMADTVLASRSKQTRRRSDDSRRDCVRFRYAEHQLLAGAVLWTLDEEGPAMKRILLIASLLFSFGAKAHVGSPDVFYDGMVGPY